MGLLDYDISRFDKYIDYLPLLNAVLITDIIVIILLLVGIIKSKTLRVWYKELNLSAVISDVLIIFIGIVITRFLYYYIFDKFHLLKFILLAVIVQIIHDLSFYKLIVSIPRGKSLIVDIFKNYGEENGFTAVIFDSLMMICSCLLAAWFSTFGMNMNLIILVFSVYLVPYLIYSV